MAPFGRLETLCPELYEHHLPLQTWPESINQVNKTALLTWMKETGIDLVQINGQRRYGGPPPGWVGDAPPTGSEVFIGKLPQDVYEDTLIPLFQSVGKLYEFRLMMTFSGLNRGFAYAKYGSRHSAKVAVSALNNFEVRKGCSILVCKSTEKCELSMDGLAASLSRKHLEVLLQEAAEGILSVTLYPSPFQKRAQLAVLKYSSHRAAAMAKKSLMEGNKRISEEDLRVEWLKPDLKQKLRCSEGKSSATWVPRVKCPGSPKEVHAPLSPVLGKALELLDALCRRRRLGTPLFFTKCVQVNRNGWLRFWCQVVIPGHPVPLSGFTWVQQDMAGASGHDKAKDMLAMQVLSVLGREVA
ncbi:dead end protein homolog 1 isoform X1 [Nothoprocta perdicaria]|uniref:dead end protein homolog 1 isoform X1 n=1 Tax=Nothoprocta perdicaria TaxID=30464 RepID=UPI000E1B6EB2|nr:dead end protein homolog 1 isoform X1 [Nothoprocta perdicaria]